MRQIELRSGDMLDPDLGVFDHVVAMDSLIHYDLPHLVNALECWAPRTSASISFTFAPRTPLLATMRSVGRLFPRSNRAPWIEPMPERELRERTRRSELLGSWRDERTQRITSGFYISQALELVR
jgi:magnesium-protoporphyrin O-methyltransferase